MRRSWQRWTLAQQFMIVSFLILVSSMIGVGWWVGEQIEAGVIHRTAATTALYVDSFVTPQLQELTQGGSLAPEQVAIPTRLLQESPLGQQIVSFKVWGPRGRVIYASNPANTGQVYPVSRDLARAWQGEVDSHVSDLDEAENNLERGQWKRLLETYIPVYATDTDRIIAVAEFYQTVDALEREISAAKWRSWLAVGTATLAIYLLLSGLVQRGSNTIVRQQRDVQETITRLTGLLGENEQLHARVRLAATRTTTLNERFLRRLSAEMHDGPAQQLSLALLRLDSVSAYCAACVRHDPAGREENITDLDRIQTSLRHALQEVRAISAGLRLPELSGLTLAATVDRVVRMHERRTGTMVAREHDDVAVDVPLPVKITVYRVIEEALNNAYRHGGGSGQSVGVHTNEGTLHIEIADRGPGFDGIPVTDSDQHLGLVGMRERVESLGGLFSIESEPGQGTRVIVQIPIQTRERDHGRTNSDGHRGRPSAAPRGRRAHAPR
ncbi:MAG: sensor histidine kinase [Thermomicrobia bacterium]|nr:sensor histidine kinase [Thermomicrobia bacterium]